MTTKRPEGDPGPEVIWLRQAERRRAIGVEAIRAELADRGLALDVAELELKTEADPSTGAPVAWTWTVILKDGTALVWRHDNIKGAMPFHP